MRLGDPQALCCDRGVVRLGGLILGGRAEVGPVRSFKAFPVLDTRPAHGINFRPYTTWWCVRELSLMATRELEPGNQAIAGGLPADVAARGCGGGGGQERDPHGGKGFDWGASKGGVFLLPQRPNLSVTRHILRHLPGPQFPHL